MTDLIVDEIIRDVLQLDYSFSSDSSNSSFDELSLRDVDIFEDEYELSNPNGDNNDDDDDDESLLLSPSLQSGDLGTDTAPENIYKRRSLPCDMCAPLDLGLESQTCIHSHLLSMKEKSRELIEIESCISRVCQTIRDKEKTTSENVEVEVPKLTEKHDEQIDIELTTSCDDSVTPHHKEITLHSQQFSGYFLTRGKLHLWLRV